MSRRRILLLILPFILVVPAQAQFQVPFAGNIPTERTLNIYAKDFARNQGTGRTFRIVHSVSAWGKDQHLFVVPLGRGIPIFRELFSPNRHPTVGGRDIMPEIVRLTYKGEYLASKEHRVTTKGVLAGYWYKVQSLDGVEGWLLVEPTNGGGPYASIRFRRLDEMVTPQPEPVDLSNLPRKTPIIDEKLFFRANSDLGEEYCLSDGKLFDAVRLADKDWLFVDCAGTLIPTEQVESLSSVLKMTLTARYIPWDVANNIPVSGLSQKGSISWYFHKLNFFLYNHPVPSIFLGVFLSLLALLAGIDLFSTGKSLIALPLIALFIYTGHLQGKDQIRYYEVAQKQMANIMEHGLSNGHYLPFVDHLEFRRVRYSEFHELRNYYYIPLLLVLAFGTVIFSVPAFRGLHFLIVPHPFEKHIPRTHRGRSNTDGVADELDFMKGSPFAWVERNRQRRLERLQKRIKGHQEVIDELIKRERKRAGLDDFESL